MNLKNNDNIEISSQRGTIQAKCIISNINEKTIFIPISHKSINTLTSSKLDPFSKEPDYNHSAVKIVKT